MRKDERRPSLTEHLDGSCAKGPEAMKEILPLVYDELRRLASHFLKSERRNHSLLTTELVHEAYFRLVGLEQISFKNRRHFFATAAQAMRRILVDQARKRHAEKRIPPEAKVDFELAAEAVQEPTFDVLALDQALESLEKISERQARVVELRYFAGLTDSQIADVLGVSRITVVRDARVAKLWLRRELRR